MFNQPVYSLERFFAELVGKSIYINAHLSNSPAAVLVFSPRTWKCSRTIEFLVGIGVVGGLPERCRWNCPPFRPRIARTMPHLGQCDATTAARYMCPSTSRGRGGAHAKVKSESCWINELGMR